MELRPLGFGEIFDRAVTLYLRNFVPFAAIVMVLVVPFAILQYIIALGSGPEMDVMFRVLQNPQVARVGHIPTLFDSPAGVAAFIVVMLVGYLLSPFVMNAVAVGVARLYRARPVEFRACYEVVIRRWLQILGLLGLEFLVIMGWYVAAIVVAIAIVFITMAITTTLPAIAVIVGVVAFLGVFFLMLPLLAPLLVALGFAMYAVVIEDQNPVAALLLGFSRVFNRAEFWRAVLFSLATGAIILGASSIFSLLSIFAAFVHWPLLEAVVQTLPTAVINPFAVVLFAIYYFDVRIRREGYDLESSLEHLGATQPA
jgi:hypothetical protein